jgi:ribosomal protein L14
LPALDDGTAGLVEDLACAIIDREDELRGVHAVLTAALALTHMQYVEIVRLKARVASLLDARRQPQRPAA